MKIIGFIIGSQDSISLKIPDSLPRFQIPIGILNDLCWIPVGVRPLALSLSQQSEKQVTLITYDWSKAAKLPKASLWHEVHVTKPPLQQCKACDKLNTVATTTITEKSNILSKGNDSEVTRHHRTVVETNQTGQMASNYII